MSWRPTTVAARDGVPGPTTVVAGCCRRRTQADMILVSTDGAEVCDSCVGFIQRAGGLVDLYTQLGAPQDVLDAIFAKHGGE